MAATHAPVDGVPGALVPDEARRAEGRLRAPTVEGPSRASGAISASQPASGGPLRVLGEADTAVRVSVVIPTLNEEENLPYVFARLPARLHEVIVVDGHSIDHTVAIARKLRPDVRIVMQTGRGKGNALATGFRDVPATSSSCSTPTGRPTPARSRGSSRRCAMALTSSRGRALPRVEAARISPSREIGNRALGALVNALYRTSYTDLCYGYNAFWARCLPYMRVDCDGFEVETLINVRIAKAGLVVHEVPSHERPRLHGTSNLSAVRDGGRVCA